jgi:hypothetical protein
MAPSSSLHSSDSTVVAEPGPVLQDSLRYWERQSATYNGVLGVCAVTSLISLSSLKLSSISNRQAATALVYALFSYLSAFVKLTRGSNVVTSPR